MRLNTDFLERISLEMLSCQRRSLLINPERTNLYKVIVELRQGTQWPIISVGFYLCDVECQTQNEKPQMD